MKLGIVVLLLAGTLSAQTQQERACLLGAVGERCSHWVKADQYPSVVAEYRVKHNWFRRHPALTGVIAGTAVGVTVGLLTRQHSCSYTYEGYPYSGTTCTAPKERPVGRPVLDPGAH